MFEVLGNETWLSKCSNETDPMHSPDPRCRKIFYARTTSAALSVLGCLIVLFIIVVYRKYHQFTQRLVLSLLPPTFVISFVSVYPDINNTDVSCEVAGFFMNWGLLSQRLVILCIVVHLLVFTFIQNRPKSLELIFHIVTWVFSLGFSVVPLPGHHYGSAGVWCWIKGQTKYDNELRFGCFYIWVWCCIAVEIVCFSIAVIRIHRQLKLFEDQTGPVIEEQKKRYKKYIYPLMLYPLLNIVLAIPVTVNRIQNWADPGNPNFSLFLCHSIVYPLWGFCNALMYFVSKETLRQLHPCSVLDQLRSWRRGTASVQVSNVPNLEKQPEVQHDYTTNILTNPTAMLSEEMNSECSDME